MMFVRDSSAAAEPAPLPPIRRSVARVRPAGLIRSRLMALTVVAIVPSNVRFQGYSGHYVDRSPCQLLIQSGHLACRHITLRRGSLREVADAAQRDRSIRPRSHRPSFGTRLRGGG